MSKKQRETLSEENLKLGNVQLTFLPLSVLHAEVQTGSRLHIFMQNRPGQVDHSPVASKRHDVKTFSSQG